MWLWMRIKEQRRGRVAHAIDPESGDRACGGTVNLEGLSPEDLLRFHKADAEVRRCPTCLSAVARKHRGDRVRTAYEVLTGAMVDG